ncbi:MAG: GH92 family glycosyl hydrolase, partial [Bifidobacteriaceae bacterium]|nr:GH92 family glycosyl hydrolase [Bifidobacteriaceae bacterium]
ARVGTPTSTQVSNAGWYVPLTTPLHDPQNEEAHPGYYMARSGSGSNIVKTEVTATTRTGVARYTFPEGSAARVLINAGWNQATGTSNISASTAQIIDNRTVVASSTMRGFCQDTLPFTIWTKTVFDRPFDLETSTTWGGDTTSPAIPSTPVAASAAQRTGAMLVFDVTDNPVVVSQTSVSFVDANGAALNLTAENVNGNFDQARSQAEAVWETRLHTIEIDADLPTQLDEVKSFYSALYRSFLAPNISDDVDGRFRGWGTGASALHNLTDPDVGLAHYYQNYSLWDTYRTQEQFLSLAAPKEASDQAKSLVLHGEYGGWAPRWTWGPVETNIMTGDPITPWITSAYEEGLLPGTWGERAYQMLKPSLDGVPAAETPYNGRQGNTEYIPYGAVPLWSNASRKAGDWDYDHGPSSTLEYTLSDGMFSRMAASLGHTEDAARYAQRGQNYKAMWDSQAVYRHTTTPIITVEGAFVARDRAGAINTYPALTGATTRFHEGTEPQYEFLTTHDMPGLIATMGGKEKAIARLDRFFRYDELVANPYETARCGWVGSCTGGSMDYYNTGYYNPNNEPDINFPFAYAWLGQPWKTADVVNATKALYRPIPEGMTGNDDLGTMSGWQVLSSIGLFPMAPGADVWGITTPAFKAVEVKIDNTFYTGNTSGKLDIRAPQRAEGVHYIQSATFNGEPWNKSFLWGSQLRAGAGELVFTVGSTPSAWATADDANPGSLAPYTGEYQDRVALQAPGSAAVPPGGSGVATPELLIQGTGEVPVTLTVPDGSPVRLADAPITVTAAADGQLARVKVPVELSVALDAAPGTYPVYINSWGLQKIAIQVSVPGDSWFLAAATAKSIGAVGANTADADSQGHYLVDRNLALGTTSASTGETPAGLVRGVRKTISGALGYTLPVTANDQADTIIPSGQTIAAAGGLQGATQLALIGFSVATAAVSVTPTLVFSDGTTQNLTALNLTNWNATSSTNREAQTLQRGLGAGLDPNVVTSGTGATTASVYRSATASFTVPTGKTVTGLTLSDQPNARILAIATNVTAASPTLDADVAITGRPVVGETVQAVYGDWSVDGVATTVQWYRGDQPISGATGDSYTLVTADAGQQLSVQVVGQAAGWATAYLVSDPVKVIGQPATAADLAKLRGLVLVYNLYDQTPDRWTVGTYTPFHQAMEEARALLAAAIAEQSEINDLCVLLPQLVLVLAEKPDTSVLEALIVAAEEVLADQANYQTAHIAELVAAIAAAQAVLANDPTQAQVTQASIELMNVLGQIHRLGDKTLLRALLGLVDSLNAAEFTPSSWTVLANAQTVGAAVEADAQASQYAIEAAVTGIENGLHGLVLKAVKQGLGSAITVARLIVASSSLYVPSSIAGLAEALASAETVYANDDATQAQVAAAQSALVAKIALAKLRNTTTPILPVSLAAKAAADPVSAGLPVAPVSAKATLAKPKLAGKAKVGAKLRVKTAAAGVSYQWYRAGKAIKSATKATYTVKQADKGKRLSVKVSRSGITKASAKTPKVR